MEIKKGISQMAEYPNVEINYVVPKSGNMHYVLKEGILDNGVIIATLDPRHAIDEANPCQNIGVFSATGEVLVDFNKKDIKRITDNLLLVVNAVPTNNLVASPDDMTAEANRKLIIQMMMEEMGPTGEIIFDDPYSEANVYATDSYNNKLGLDCSFIGKNNEGLYFHTNDINSLSKFIKVDEFSNQDMLMTGFANPTEGFDTNPSELNTNEEELQLDINPTILGGFQSPQDASQIENDSTLEETLEPESMVTNDSNQQIEDKNNDTVFNVEEPSIINEEKIDSLDEEKKEVSEMDEAIEDEIDENSNEIKSDSSQNIASEVEEETVDEDLDEEEEDVDYIEDDDDTDYDSDDDDGLRYEEDEEEDEEMEKTKKNTRRKSVMLDDGDNENEVLDNAIELINKMLEETDKLNRRIKKLESKLEQRENVIEEQTRLIKKQDQKKGELNSLLNKANRVLDNME